MFHLSGGEKEKQRQTADMRGENAEMKQIILKRHSIHPMENDDFIEAMQNFNEIYQKANHLYGNGYTLDASRMKMDNLGKKNKR